MWTIVCRSHCGRGWRPTPALWCLCVRRRTMTSGRASTHCRWLRKHLFLSSRLVVHIAFASHCMFLCVQFLHGRGLKQVDVRTIQCVSVGQKDQNKGLFHLWQEIFQLPRTKRYRALRHRFHDIETKNRVLEQNHCSEWWAWNFSFLLQPVGSNYHLFSAAFPGSGRLKILGKFNRNLNSCNALIPQCWLDPI